MGKTAVFYGSSTGNTQAVAKQIAAKLNADIYDVADKPVDKLVEYENLIFGTATMGLGDLQDDWDLFLPLVKKADLTGKVVAIFGLGDSESYPDTFVDGIGFIYEAVKSKGCKITGYTSTVGYDYDRSFAEADGMFAGLPIDEDNQSDLTEKRIDTWIGQIMPELK